MREIIIDTETTGLDPSRGHKIIEFGALEMINHSLTGKKLHLYINPKREIEETAFQVHGISSTFLESKPKFDEIAKEIINFIGDDKIIVHNAPFDIGFINHELDECQLDKFEMNQVIDTLVLARKKFPGSPANLDALCKRFNISLEKREKHGALLDAELLAAVYLELLGGKQREFNILSKNANDKNIKEPSKVSKKKLLPRKHLSKLNSDEIKEHLELLKEIKKPIWKKYMN